MRVPLIKIVMSCSETWSMSQNGRNLPRSRYLVARKSASIFIRTARGSFAYDVKESWCPLIQWNDMGRRMSGCHKSLYQWQNVSLVWLPDSVCSLLLTFRCILDLADLPSVKQLNLRECRPESPWDHRYQEQWWGSKTTVFAAGRICGVRCK